MADQNTENKHQSLSSLRLLTIMEHLAAKRAPVRLIDLSRELEMTQPTVLRYLSALCSEGYAYQDPASGCYALSWKICGMADQVRGSSLQAIVHPYLSSLSEKLHAGALLATERDGSIAYLDLVAGMGSMETFLRIGRDAPIHSISSGKIMLSAKDDMQILKILEEKGMPAVTPNTITEPLRMLREINAVREQGFARDDEECEMGHACLSVPLRDYSGAIVAAVSVFDRAERMKAPGEEEKILAALREAAAAISARLGWSGR